MTSRFTVMPYDWGTHWPGVLERHADRCPFSDGEACTCGPLGYIASIPDPDSGERVSSPMLETAAEARAWRREQEWAIDPDHAAGLNGQGPARPAPRARPASPANPARPSMRREAAAERWGPPATRPDRAPRRRSESSRDDVSVAQLIERF